LLNRGRHRYNGIRILPGPRLGNSVIEVDHLRKSVDGRKLFAGACHSRCCATEVVSGGHDVLQIGGRD
jgi:hypothetical protein